MIRPYFDEDGITIYHGAALEIAPQIAGVDAMISDPPYGMKWHAARLTGGPGGNTPGLKTRTDWGTIQGDDRPFDPGPWLEYPRVVLWGSNHYPGLPVGTTLVWIKRFDAAFGSFLSDAEVAWMKGGHGVYCRRDTTGYSRPEERLHPCEKPIGIMRWCIEKAGGSGLILDPFMGSGTTLRAAKDMGRRAIGIELEERYCEVAARRMAQTILPFGAP